MALRGTGTELTVVFAVAGLLLVLTDGLVIWLLGFLEPAWGGAVAHMDHGQRIALLGGPSAALFLGAVFYLERRLLAREQWEGTGFIYTSREHPSEVWIGDLEAETLLERLRQLRAQIPTASPELGREALNEVHLWEGRFDPNRWFEVFDRVRPRPGYVLDFVYFFWGNGGYPLLYLRRERSKRLESCSEYWRRFGGDLAHPVPHDNPALLEHLGFQPSALGFFQFLLFQREAPRFHLRWHSHADDDEYVYTRRRLAEILETIPEKDGELLDGISADERALLQALDPKPVVALMGKIADLKLLSYTRFGGFSWQDYRVTWPNHAEQLRSQPIVAYHQPLHY